MTKAIPPGAAPLVGTPGREDLTPKQLLAAEALAHGRSIAESARIAGVHRDTIASWRSNQPAFSEAVTKAVQDLIDGRRIEMAQLFDESIALTRQAVRDGNVDAAIAVLRVQHVAAFIGGAAPGATRVEGVGHLTMPNIEVRFVGVDGRTVDLQPAPEPADAPSARASGAGEG